jgi:hypothetical protein
MSLQEISREFATSLEIARDALDNAKRKFDDAFDERLDKTPECTPKPESLRELLTCPITRELMVVPKTLPCGHTFESYKIAEHLERVPECPMCRRHVSVVRLAEIDMSVCVAALIDKTFEGYRAAKRQKNTLYDSGITDPLVKMYRMGLEKNTENIKKALGILDQLMDKMAVEGWITNGLQITDPMHPDANWKFIAEQYISNQFVKSAIDEYLQPRKYKFTVIKSHDSKSNGYARIAFDPIK